MVIRERHWARELEAVSLVAEALDSVPPEHRDQALEVLGSIVRKQPDAYHRGLVLRRWPAVHVIATTGVAVDHFSNNTFWPKLHDLLGVRSDTGFAREWGNAFLDNLARLGLPTFAELEGDAGTRYVGRILMHSGMPTFCLTDFLALVSDRRRKVPGLEPEQFTSWARGRAELRQLHGVDMPVVRFLQYGGDFAGDVIARAFELLDVVTAGADPREVPLPLRFRQAAIDLWQKGLVSAAATGSGKPSTDGDTQPRLVLEPFGRGPLLRLPPVGEAPDGRASWIVNLDGVAQTIATRALFPGIDDVAPTTDVPLPHPARAAAVALSGREHLQMTLPILDDRLPLLAFGDDGAAIAPGATLPARHTWLLFPGEPSTLQTSGEAPLAAESPLPPGWSGWCLLLVDLAKARSVGLSGFELTRSVRTDFSARIVAPEPVPGVRTTRGQFVYPGLPAVVLPEGMSGARWEITLQGEDQVVLSRWVSDSGIPVGDVWRNTPTGLVGTFTVRVRGPWGRGASRRLTIVEGLAAEFTPPWRRFIPEGLQPAAAVLRAQSSIQLSRSVLDFDAHQREAYVRVSNGPGFVTLSVTPPHMSVAYQTDADSTSPSIRPLRLFREDLTSNPGTLILDLGSAGEPTLHLRTPIGVVQTIRAGAGRAGTYRFDLARLVDTLAHEPHGELTLDPDGHITVATVRPRKLFQAVAFRDSELVFEDAVEIPGLTALVYAARAPWRAPAELLITAGKTQLPPWLVRAGDLSVVVRIDDPWAPAPVPDWPVKGQAVAVPQEGHVVGESDEETELSAFLAGLRPLPPAPENLDRLWMIRGLIGRLGLGTRTGEVADAVDAALAAQPRQALVSIAKSRLSLDAIPRLMVSASLPWADLSQVHEDEPPAWNQRSALPGMLLSAADGEWSEDEIAEASGVLGDDITTLLAGSDPHAAAGRLGASTDLYDAQPAIRGELVRPLKLVPKALLDADSRTMASIEFVDNRRNPKLEWLNRNARRILAEAETLLTATGHPEGAEAVRQRRHPTADSGWRLLPALSLAYAFMARHAARGRRGPLSWIVGQQRPWTDLAQVAPSMVTIDLIVAELLTAHCYASMENGA